MIHRVVMAFAVVLSITAPAGAQGNPNPPSARPEPTRQGGRPIVIGAVAGALAGCIIGVIVAWDDSGGPGAGTLCAVAGLICGSIGADIGLVVKTIRSQLAPSRQW